MEHKHDTGISRRGFLSSAAASGALLAAGAMTGCAPALRNEGSKVKAKNEAASAAASADAGTPDWLGEAPAITDAQCKEVLDFEVCVIGAGTSGYFAACAAAEEGLKTILIEKSASGNNIRSSSLGAVGTKAQKKIGAEAKIDPMDIVNDMDHYALGQVSSSLIRKWALNSGEAIDWYTEVLAKGKFEVQLEYNMPKGTRYKEWPTGHGTNGEYPSREGDVAKYLDKYILSFDGCEERFLTPMRRLITGESGRVVGVYAEGPDGMIRINASKGVIVATGGYASNQDMYKTLQPTRYSCLGTFDAFPSCTGDGIKALLWLGAKLDDVHTSLTFNRCLLTADQKTGDPYNVGADNYGYHFFASQPFLRVDAHGKRFHNESAPYDFVMSALSKHPEDERYWHQVWDSNWKKDVPRFHTVGCSTIYYHGPGCDHDAFPGELDVWIEPEMEEYVSKGYLVKADTLSELADKLGFEGEDKKNFLATCKRQNENFDKQDDPDFGKEAFRLSELRKAPFYASVKSCGLTLCTLDGVQVNDNLQPYGADGKPIEGVYVVGNDQGCFYAGNYPNLAAGINAGRSATFGRMVAKSLAK